MQSVTNTKTKVEQLSPLFWMATLVTLSLLMIIGQLAAQDPSQKTFSSAQDAVRAMISAVRTNDMNQLMAIFGPQGKEILHSGDDVADKHAREEVLKKYDQMRRLVIEPDKTVVIYMGAEHWPFPIPLVNKNNVWFFDAAAGKDEVLYRRIGRNELATMDTLQALVDAQKEYASKLRQGETVKQYAQKVLSDEGKHNGLYWKTSAGE